MRHARAGLQHDACHTADGNVRQHWSHAQALLIDADESAIDNVDFAPFDEHDGQALLDRDGFEGWQHVPMDDFQAPVCGVFKEPIPRRLLSDNF
jgi:hypothetical protein